MQVLDVCVECCEHCTDEAWQQRLSQTMLDIMARRPVLDLTQSYFSESYSTEIVAVQLEASLMRECLAGQMVQVILEHTSAYVSIRSSAARGVAYARVPRRPDGAGHT